MKSLAALVAMIASASAAAATLQVPTDPRAAEARGTLRVLVIRATWGPQPVETETALASLAEATAFYKRTSFGRLNLQVDLSPWLPVSSSITCHVRPASRSFLGQLGELAQDAAAAAGYDISSYRRLAYVFPAPVCGYGGLGVDREILLAHEGALSEGMTFVHELGHTFGLPHATRSRCARGCRVIEYGDPHSPMGAGTRDFSAFEKLQLGWITSVRRVTAAGTYEIGSIDRAGSEPQALVVPTAAGEYWLEHRITSRPHLLARVVRPNNEFRPRYFRTIFLGQSDARFVARGVFSVIPTGADGSTAHLAFTWTDRVPPTRPRLDVMRRARAGEQMLLLWTRSQDNGSGVAGYRVLIDGRVVAERSAAQAVISGLARGRHRVAVEALDRAGNRSRDAVTVVVK